MLKEGAFRCNEIANIYVLVRNGANMANFIRQMPMIQKTFKIFGSDSAFCGKELKGIVVE